MDTPECPSQKFDLSFLGTIGAAVSPNDADQVACLGRWGTGRIYEVDYSPDGGRVAVRSSMGITLYEAGTLQEVAFLHLPVDPRLGMLQPGLTDLMGFANAGEILAVAAGEKVALYRASDGSSLGALFGEGENAPLMTLAVSPDGKLLAGSEGWSQDVNIWSVPDGELLLSWQDAAPSELTFSPDGKLLVSSNGQVRDVSDGTIPYDLEIGGCCLSEVTFSPDGRYMIALWDQDGILKMWKTEDGELVHSFDGYGKILFSADSSEVTLVTPGFVMQTISTADGKLLKSDSFENPELASQYVLTFFADGTRMVTGSFDGMVNLWDLSDGRLIHALGGHPGGVRMAQLSPDGEVLLTADETWVRKWRMTDGSPLGARQHAYPAVVLSPDGGSLLTELKYSGGLQVWNAADGYLRYSVENARWPLVFSGDGELFAASERNVSESGYISDTIQIRQVMDGSLLYQLDSDDNEFDNPNYDLAFSSDGGYLAAVHDPGDIVVWRTAESLPLYRLTSGDYLPFIKLAISADGEYLATGNSGHTVQVWRLETGELVQELPMEPTEIMGTSGAVGGVLFSPDGKILAAVDEGGYYQVWQVSDWSPLGHGSDFVNQYDPWRSAVGMAFSPDGILLATAGTGGAVSLWEVTSGEMLVSLKGHVDGILRVGFSPDGRWLYSVSLDGSVRFWGLAEE